MQCDKAESNHSQLTKSQLVTLQVLFRLEDWLLISRKICLLPSTRAVSRIQKGSWYSSHRTPQVTWPLLYVSISNRIATNRR